MDYLNLNFLPLSCREFQFTIYRRKSLNTERKAIDAPRFRLKEEVSGDYEYFDISWEPAVGYEEYLAASKDNYDLTKQFILEKIKNSLGNTEGSLEYYFPTNTFYKEVRFVIKKFKEGNTEIRIQPYYLSMDQTFGILIQHNFRVAKDQPFNREVQRLSLSLDNKYQQNKGFYRDKYYFVTEFISKHVSLISKNLSGITFSDSLVSLPYDKLNTKTYVVGGGRQSNSQFTGVKNYGPHTSVEKNVRYLFVFPESLRALARDVYSGLEGRLFSSLFPGLATMFGLPFNKENVEHLLFSEYSADAIEQIKEKVSAIKEEHGCDVFVLVFLASSLSEYQNDEVYSHIKLMSIENGFYTQCIKQETMGRKEQLKWSIANIGLQIFSKLGGTPWLLRPSHKKCLIFGVGSAHEKDIEGKIKKYTAYTICIDTKGNFNSVRPLASSSDRDFYLKSLSEELVGVIKSQSYQDIEECVIHIPYKIERKEIEAIKLSVQLLTESVNFEIKVIKINTKHKFFGFSSHNTKIPYESSMLQLSKKEYLVWTEGLQYGKETVNRRISEPIHIDFLYGGNGDYDEDKTYLQDIINLTGANWRGFNSKAQPISIYYSKLIADFMKRFGKYEYLSDYSALSEVSENPWFL